MKGNLTRRGKTSWRFRFEVSANPRVTKSHTLRGTRKQLRKLPPRSSPSMAPDSTSIRTS
jgi:hypothetical protein